MLVGVLIFSACVFGAKMTDSPKKGSASDLQIVSATPIDDSYLLNSVIKVGETKVKDESGKEYASTSSFLIYPNEQVVGGDNFSLNQPGSYTFVCSAKVDGEVLYAKKTFNVYNSAYSITAGGEYSFTDSVATVGKQDVSGLEITLNDGSVFTYNKPIDISGLTEKDSFVTIYPHTLSTLLGANYLATDSAKTTVVRLTDCYDSSIYIDFEVSFDKLANGDRTKFWRDQYFRVGTNNQRPLGLALNTSGVAPQWYLDIYYNGARYIGYEEPVVEANEWGPYGARLDVGQENADDMGYGFTFNSETGEVYGKYESLNEYVFITNLKSEEIYGEGNTFKGFTTGEVYLSIFGQYYYGNQLKVDVTNILSDSGEALNATFAVDTTAPNVVVSGNRENSFTVAKGEEIDLFSLKSVDVNGVKETSVAVYYEYGTNYQSICNCIDGKFKPDKVGVYTAVYSVKDVYGNAREVLYSFASKEVQNGVAVTLKREGSGLALQESNAVTVEMGKEYTLQNAVLESIDKKSETYCDIVCVFVASGESKTIDFDNPSLSFDNTGLYKIIYTYGDSLHEYTKEFSVTSEPSSVVKIETPVLPTYFIMGAEYTPDAVKVVKFNSNEPSYEQPEVYKQENGGEWTKVENYEALKVTSAGKVKFSYRYGGEELYVTEEIPVIDVDFNGNIKLDEYIQGTNIVKTKDNKAVHVARAAGATSAEFDFINFLSYNNFSIEFFVSKIFDQSDSVIGFKNDFEEFSIILTDYYDKSNRQEIIYKLSDDDGFSIIHGGVTYDGKGKFSDNQSLSFDSLTGEFVTQSSIRIASACNFKGDRILVSFAIRGGKTNGNASISLSFLCKQKLNSKESGDKLKPMISKKLAQGDWTVGSTITFTYADVADVLAPYNVKGWDLSVTDEKGNYLTDIISGKLLKNVNFMQDSFQFKIEDYGTYSIAYKYKDHAGNEIVDSTAIIVTDVINPTFTLNGIGNGGRVRTTAGSEVSLFGYEVSDNRSSAENIFVSVTVWDPSGFLNTCTSTMKFTTRQKGVYTVRYFAYDEVGNFATAYYEIEVI